MATTKELEIKITHLEDAQEKSDKKLDIIWDETKKLGYMITAHSLTAAALAGSALWFLSKSSIKITLG